MKKAVMYGAGSVGRGFMAELFDRSGYETVFIDTNAERIRLLQEAGEYPLRFVSNDREHEIRIRHVSGICTGSGQTEEDRAGWEKAAEAIAQADLMATSVGKAALPQIAPCIAAGIRKRWEQKTGQPLNIIVCENMIHANRYLRECIRKELEKTAPPEKDSLLSFFEEQIGTVETCIGRNVPVMTPELCGDHPLRVLAEEYHLLPVDAAAFRGDIPKLYGMKPVPSFEYYIREKLFIYNMAHAVIGFLGSLRDIYRLCDAVEEPDIRYVADKALTEISRAMAKEYDRPLEALLEYGDSLLLRFHNKKLNIQVPRLAQDPIRKLEPDDRLIGAARLCEKHGVFPAFIAVGIAAGYCCGLEEGRNVRAAGQTGWPRDPEAEELQERIRNSGIRQVLTEISELQPEEPLYETVLHLYAFFREGRPLREIILEAAKQAVPSASKQDPNEDREEKEEA